MSKSVSSNSSVNRQADRSALLSFCIAFLLTLVVHASLDHPSGNVSTALFLVVGTPSYLGSRLLLWGLQRVRGLTIRWVWPEVIYVGKPIFR